MLPLCFAHSEFRVWGLRPYSKSSLTLNEWKLNLSFSRVSLLFLNSLSVSVVPYYVTNHPPAIQKQHWHSREAQIEPPLIECEWAFRIQALEFNAHILKAHLHSMSGSSMWASRECHCCFWIVGGLVSYLDYYVTTPPPLIEYMWVWVSF
jgi:hypothetical protein